MKRIYYIIIFCYIYIIIYNYCNYKNYKYTDNIENFDISTNGRCGDYEGNFKKCPSG